MSISNDIKSLLDIQDESKCLNLKTKLYYIENRLFYPYNNGRMEGINNKIKVLNRVA